MSNHANSSGSTSTNDSSIVSKSSAVPRIVVAHRVFSVLMLCLGLLFIGIGLTLISKRESISAYNRSRGKIWYSGEQARAEFYVVAGLTYAAAYAVGFFLPRRKFTYIYLTVLIPLGCWNVIGIVFAPILCIWWFRKYNRCHFGFT